MNAEIFKQLPSILQVTLQIWNNSLIVTRELVLILDVPIFNIEVFIRHIFQTVFICKVIHSPHKHDVLVYRQLYSHLDFNE